MCPLSLENLRILSKSDVPFSLTVLRNSIKEVTFWGNEIPFNSTGSNVGVRNENCKEYGIDEGPDSAVRYYR